MFTQPCHDGIKLFSKAMHDSAWKSLQQILSAGPEDPLQRPHTQCLHNKKLNSPWGHSWTKRRATSQLQQSLKDLNERCQLRLAPISTLHQALFALPLCSEAIYYLSTWIDVLGMMIYGSVQFN